MPVIEKFTAQIINTRIIEKKHCRKDKQNAEV